jgi:hypothetical protein
VNFLATQRSAPPLEWFRGRQEEAAREFDRACAAIPQEVQAVREAVEALDVIIAAGKKTGRCAAAEHARNACVAFLHTDASILAVEAAMGRWQDAYIKANQRARLDEKYKMAVRSAAAARAAVGCSDCIAAASCDAAEGKGAAA